jgi:hypothetical protein
MKNEATRLPATGETPIKMSAGRYLATRLSTLKPPMDKVENPITVLRLLSSKQWLFFFCAFGEFRRLRGDEFVENWKIR